MQCSLLLKDQPCIFLGEILVLENGNELQVADMIMNNDIGEMGSVDLLDEESSSSSSNNKPSFQVEVDSSSNDDSKFHGRRILIKKRSVRNRFSKCSKTRGALSNHGRTIRTRGGISKHARKTVRTRGEVQNCRTRDAAHTCHSQLNETMGNNAGSNKQHNDIIDDSTNRNKQQYVSMDNGNAKEYKCCQHLRNISN